MSSKIVISSILFAMMQVGVAHAQSSDTIAQSLFDEGRKLMAKKKFAEACPRLERSYQLDQAAGTLLNVAVCHEAIGKTASAWNEFRDALAMARRENREDRMKFAQTHIDALKDRLSTLTVRAATQEPGLEWKIDGAKVGTEALGIALPINPGTHTVEAVAPGKKAWQTTIEIHRDGESPAIDIPALVALPKLAPLPIVEPPVVVEKSRGVSPWAFVAGTVGVLGFGAMALGGIESFAKWNDRTAACGIGGDPNACSQAGIDADKQARTWAIVADIGLGVGAAGTIVTIIVLAVGRGKSKEPTASTHVSFAPILTPSTAGLTFSARF